MGIRILIVEDDPSIADFIVRGLREDGYAVVHAAGGREGRHRLSTESWDVVLLDWWLPDIDGVTLLRNCAKRWQHTGLVVDGQRRRFRSSSWLGRGRGRLFVQALCI